MKMDTKTIVTFLRNCGLQHKRECIPPTCEDCIEGIIRRANPTKEQLRIEAELENAREMIKKVISKRG